MVEVTADAASAPVKRASMRTVVAASAAGTAFEWYDFFVFGSLTSIIGKNFFSGLDATAGLLAALALFGAGFFFRPVGALIFGGLGDRIGRKAAFLVTVTMMGGATFCIGLLPTYQQAGPISPLLLILLRIIQGTALGGEYGGAAIYVAEHAERRRRGSRTAWVQASAAFGLVGALGAILATQTLMGDTAFAAPTWTGGWRVPFLLSAGLLAISIWMRLKLTESPAFKALKDAGKETKAPYSEAFGQWKNLKLVLIVLIAFMSAQGAAWYTLFFYAEQVFLEQFLKLDSATGRFLLIAITIISAPLYVVFAALSDRVGRKWVMWGGMALFLVFLYPGFRLMEQLANPALAEAQSRTPVVVAADPARCSFQLDITGKTAFATSCDLAKSALSNAGISYRNEAAPAGALAEVRIGAAVVVPSLEAAGMDATHLKAAKAAVAGKLKAALVQAGYPAKADPARVNFLGLLAVLSVFVVACTALFGPMAACLVETFPTRVRYTAMSLPYHIGTGWVGGFVPFIAFAIVTATGNIYAGLWYPAIFTGISVITLPFLLKETSGKVLE
jgi:MFS family permease